MTSTPSSLVRETVDRLRAAGCVFAEEETRLLLAEAPTPADVEHMVARRVSGVPLEQVLGWVECCGIRIALAPGVFVPRRRTELLVREAAVPLRESTRSAGPTGTVGTLAPLVVVDLCCGSGAVGAALVAHLAEAGAETELHAVDVDPAAVACARRNLPAKARVHEGDLYGPLPHSLRGRVDVLVANAPYVPTAEIPLMPPEARVHEARVALDGGVDGLDVQRRIIADARRWLAPGGHLLVETSGRQASGTRDAFVRSGLVPRLVRDDETGATVVVGGLARPSGRAGRD